MYDPWFHHLVSLAHVSVATQILYEGRWFLILSIHFSRNFPFESIDIVCNESTVV